MTNSEVKQMMIDSSVEGERHLWNSEVEVCEIVGNLVALTKAKRVLEIGVFQGLTSEEIIKRLPDNSYFAGIDIEDFRLSNHNWIVNQHGLVISYLVVLLIPKHTDNLKISSISFL